MDAEADNEETPVKKTKVTKKGTAKQVKKPAMKPREEVVTDEAGSGDEEAENVKPKPKAKAKAAPKSKPAAGGKKKAQGEKAKMDAVADIEEAFDPELAGDEMFGATLGNGKDDDEMTEMKFEEEV